MSAQGEERDEAIFKRWDGVLKRLAEGPREPYPAYHVIEHRYISTACLHGRHGECRLQCKFCEARCECECHKARSGA